MQLKLQHNGVSGNTKQKEFSLKNEGNNYMMRQHMRLPLNVLFEGFENLLIANISLNTW